MSVASGHLAMAKPTVTSDEEARYCKGDPTKLPASACCVDQLADGTDQYKKNPDLVLMEHNCKAVPSTLKGGVYNVSTTWQDKDTGWNYSNCRQFGRNCSNGECQNLTAFHCRMPGPPESGETYQYKLTCGTDGQKLYKWIPDEKDGKTYRCAESKDTHPTVPVIDEIPCSPNYICAYKETKEFSPEEIKKIDTKRKNGNVSETTLNKCDEISGITQEDLVCTTNKAPIRVICKGGQWRTLRSKTNPIHYCINPNK